MKFRKQSHCIYICDYHIILPTKYGRKIINPGIFAYLELKLKEVRKYYPEIQIKTVNHDQDHLHLLVSIPPKQSIGSVVRILKANTSKSIKQKFLFLKQVYWGTDSIWSNGYCVSTVGMNEQIIKQYIENQGKDDSGQAKLELG